MDASALNADGRKGQTALRAYAIGVLSAVVALGLRQLLAPLLGNQILYLVLCPAVVFSVWYCGVGPAIATIAIGSAGIWFWFLPHTGHSVWSGHTNVEYTSFVGFLIVSGLIIVMGESNRRGRLREQIYADEARAATAKFKAVFEQTTVFAGVMSLDGIMLDANRLSLDMCGYRAEDIIGQPFWETAWWRGSAEAQAQIRAATLQAARGEAFREVLPYRWADGSEHVVDFALHPIRDNQGRMIFLHPTGVDITDLKNVEKKYRQLTTTLEEQVLGRTEELEHRTGQLRDLSRRLLQIQDSERRRIARELHDSAGQVLAALGMNMQAMLLETQQVSPKLTQVAQENFALTQQLTQSIRTMSYLLHPPLLDEVGLPAALDWYVRGLKERGGVDISLTMPEKFSRMPADLELAVFRVVQECLTNIHRHSGCKNASIQLATQEHVLHVVVSDDGRGISPEKLLEIHSHGSGVGFQGMRERLAPYEGTMQIDSGPSGTTVAVTFQVPNFKSVSA
jgi:PAS domain S-box-containing protein